MRRFIEKDLLAWKDHPARKPLIIRGARQIGKSFVVERFGKEHFKNCVVINFEVDKKCMNSFASLDPQKITASLSALKQQDIIPGETLLFIDEIQECPEAIQALRYFKEKLPSLHVVAAGSLLEFVLNQPNFRMPVGRVQSMYMYPCSFYEYLSASDHQRAIAYLQQANVKDGVDEALHQMLLEKVREYFILGGMPEVLAYFIENNDYNYTQVIQGDLRNTYRDDFGKYDKKIKLDYLLKIYDKLPGLVAKITKFVEIDPNVQSRDLKPAISALRDAGLIHQVYHTAASGLPLNTVMNERRYKLLMVDIGLLSSASGLVFQELFNEELILLNRGALAEQFVGQELIVCAKNFERSQLYFWDRSKPASAEVDYIIHHGSEILPVEVKSGKTGRLKSLKQFVEKRGAKFGIRISEKSLSFEDGVLSVPFYMVPELQRMVGELLAKH